MDSTMMAGIMGLFGTLIGGVIAYKGSISATENAFILMRKNQEILARKRLHQQLSLIITKAAAAHMGADDLFIGGTFIYDKEWPQLITFLDNLEENELVRILNILEYFTWAEEYRKERDGMISADVLRKFPLNYVEDVAKLLPKIWRE
jgi:hypothetical protein